MSDSESAKVGTIGWQDLTVENADEIRDFYRSVVGWTHEPVGMGEYDDYNMVPPQGGDGVAGICHKRGTNADLPAQWMLYFIVEDVEKSVAACTTGGGEIISGPRPMAAGRFCVIRDPAGAVCALYQEKV